MAVTRTSVISPGTEVGAFAGLPPLRPGVTYPRLVGYCNLAEVIAAGPEVKHAAMGKRILTFESHRSAFRAAEDTVIAVVSDDVKPHRAAATYLYHLGYTALLRADFRPGETVAVVGLGTLGLATVAVAAAAGASVIALGDQAAARERSLAAGARAAHPKRDRRARHCRRVHHGGARRDRRRGDDVEQLGRLGPRPAPAPQGRHHRRARFPGPRQA